MFCLILLTPKGLSTSTIKASGSLLKWETDSVVIGFQQAVRGQARSRINLGPVCRHFVYAYPRKLIMRPKITSLSKLPETLVGPQSRGPGPMEGVPPESPVLVAKFWCPTAFYMNLSLQYLANDTSAMNHHYWSHSFPQTTHDNP